MRVVRNGETVTIALSGEFDLATLREVEAGFEEAAGDGSGQIVVDLRELTFIDSTGIAFLLAATRADAKDRLTFIPSESLGVRRVLGITGVDDILGGEATNKAAV